MLNRFLTRRARLYADFAKAVIEKAAPILDLNERKRFLERELATWFGFRQVLVSQDAELTRFAQEQGGDVFHVSRSRSRRAGWWKRRLGWNGWQASARLRQRSRN